AIQPKLELLSIINRSLAEKTETLVFDQEGTHLSILTTNNNPQLYRQVIDKLEAQGYQHTSSYTDDKGFAIAMKRYDALATQEAKDAATLDWRTHAGGDDAI